MPHAPTLSRRAGAMAWRPRDATRSSAASSSSPCSTTSPISTRRRMCRRICPGACPGCQPCVDLRGAHVVGAQALDGTCIISMLACSLWQLSLSITRDCLLHVSTGMQTSTSRLVSFDHIAMRLFPAWMDIGRSTIRTLCPSGLRGWTQVPLAQAAWVQIPQVSYLTLTSFLVSVLSDRAKMGGKRRTKMCQLWGSNPRGLESSGS